MMASSLSIPESFKTETEQLQKNHYASSEDFHFGSMLCLSAFRPECKTCVRSYVDKYQERDLELYLSRALFEHDDKNPLKNKKIRLLLELIVKIQTGNSTHTSNVVCISTLKVHLMHKEDTTTHTVFRITGPAEKVQFVDDYARVYKNFEDYWLNNKLFDTEIACYPQSGRYALDEKCNLKLCYGPTAAAALSRKITSAMHAGVNVVSGGLLAAGLFTPAAPVLIASAAAGVVAGTFTAGLGIKKLKDRREHGQKLTGRDAVLPWCETFGGLFGAAASTGMVAVKTLSVLGTVIPEKATSAAKTAYIISQSALNSVPLVVLSENQERSSSYSIAQVRVNALTGVVVQTVIIYYTFGTPLFINPVTFVEFCWEIVKKVLEILRPVRKQILALLFDLTVKVANDRIQNKRSSNEEFFLKHTSDTSDKADKRSSEELQLEEMAAFLQKNAESLQKNERRLEPRAQSLLRDMTAKFKETPFQKEFIRAAHIFLDLLKCEGFEKATMILNSAIDFAKRWVRLNMPWKEESDETRSERERDFVLGAKYVSAFLIVHEVNEKEERYHVPIDHCWHWNSEGQFSEEDYLLLGRHAFQCTAKGDIVRSGRSVQVYFKEIGILIAETQVQDRKIILKTYRKVRDE